MRVEGTRISGRGKSLILLSLLLSAPGAWSAEPLSKLASTALQMQPNEWVLLNPASDFDPPDGQAGAYTRPFDVALAEADAAGVITRCEFGWLDSMSWEPRAQKLSFVEAGCGPDEYQEFVYDLQSNTWTWREFDALLDLPPAVGHAYDMNGSDLSGRIFFHRWGDVTWQGVWSPGGYQYTPLPVLPETFGAGALEFVPFLNDRDGAVVILNSTGGYWLDESSGRWMSTNPSLEAPFGQHMHLEVSLADEFAMVAQGTTSWLLEGAASGLRQDSTPLPCEASTNKTDLIYDPGSESLILACGGRSLYQYRYTPNEAGVWSPLSDLSAFPQALESGFAAVGLPEYGVTAFVKLGSADACLAGSQQYQCGIYLAKLPPVADRRAPRAPLSFTAAD